MKNNKIFFIIGIVVIIVLLVVAMNLPEKNNDKLLGINYDIKGNEAKLDKYETDNPVVALYVEGYGSIIIELYPEIAPNTVNNFISLIKSGFYDNNSFHRLDPGFVLQGGDPNGTGAGGPGYSIKGEFSANGFENTLKHEKGVVSMARSGSSYDSAGSQFFIMLGDKESLDGQYAAFGRVIDGFDLVEKMEENEEVADETSGKLQTNLVLKKALVDLKGKKYPKVEKIEG